ncbi:MAG: O-antigen ligase family protein [Gemmatimonadaceae bacterium]
MSAAAGPRGTRFAAAALSVGAVAVILATVPFKAFDLDRFFLPKELVLHVVALAAVLPLLASATRLRLTRVDVLLVAYLVLSGLSAIFAGNRWLAGRSLAISLSAAAVFWSARAAAQVGVQRALLVALALAAVLAALTALLQAYGVDSAYISLNRAPGGTLGNRNFVAHVAVIGLPLLLLCALRARARAGGVLGAFGVMLLTAALVLSRSRAAWLALLVSAALALIARVIWRRMWRGAALGGRARLMVLGALVGGGLAIWLPNTLNWRSDSPYLDSMRGVVNYQEGSGHGRVLQYENTLRMALAHPLLGVGTGNWSVRYPDFARGTDPSLDDDDGMTSNPWPSSDWMAVVAERGVPALICLALVLLGIAVNAGTALYRARNAAELLPPLALVLALAAAVVVSAFDAVLLLPASALLLWALLGALLPSAAIRATVELHGRRRGWLFGFTAVLGALVIARSAAQIAAMTVYNPDGHVADMTRAARYDPGSYRIQIRLAEVYAGRGRCDLVRRYGQNARDLYPAAPEPRRLLRRCGVRERRP